MTRKVALNTGITGITGITGQDGAYLAEFLLDKGYIVHGIRRRTSLFNTDRIDHLYQDTHEAGVRMFLHYGDMTDSSSLTRILQQTQPDEIYNLAAQSHVHVSFDEPEYTANLDALGPLRMLEAIRILGMEKRVKFYQASTSELYGLVQEAPQKETTPFYPRSPYAVDKLFASAGLSVKRHIKTTTVQDQQPASFWRADVAKLERLTGARPTLSGVTVFRQVAALL